MKKRNFAAAAATVMLAPVALATGLGSVKFIVTDPQSGRAVDGLVHLVDQRGRTVTILAIPGAPNLFSFDTRSWVSKRDLYATVIRIPVGVTASIRQKSQLPTKDIEIEVSATRLTISKPSPGSSGTIRDGAEIKKYGGGGGNDTKTLTKGQAGVAEDSAGQAHVRGEHNAIAFVVDGVPLPDTLSGRQGSVVVPSTIQSLEMITGGFAPEFGGQTAAVLNIKTVSQIAKPRIDLSMRSATFNGFGGELTAVGHLGPRASYVINASSDRTSNAGESPQPNDQTAHNAGSSRGFFTKLRFEPSASDSYTLTLSQNASAAQIANRTGLGSSFATVGQGYGLFGLRDADGNRPDANGTNSGLLGAGSVLLASQQAAGQDISQSESSEYATLNYVRRLSKTDFAQLAVTLLHSGQDTTNRNPLVDLFNLPVDNSIEFSPTTNRNVHHVQVSGSLESVKGSHVIKVGLLVDRQSGNEGYQILPGSQLALDALANIAPNLAPPGTASATLDINGNPVFTPSGPSPTLHVQRSGAYQALYLQDTYTSGRLILNGGLRQDWYSQSQNLGQDSVNASELSPRLNFQYQADRSTEVRASYGRLFNVPPVAQGAVVGQAIQPEILTQYDLGLTRKLTATQSVTLAYYYKDIRNQVDTGLLIPGSQIGLYSAVNFQRGGVHGIEFSYNVAAPKGVGWDSYFNYSLSWARPNGLDNTGKAVADFNDHDQRHTLGLGLAYTWRSGAVAALTFDYGSGLASSVVPPNHSRTSRSTVGIHLASGDHVFHGQGGLALDISNLLDDRTVINFQSAFSGTRFQQGRVISLTASLHF